MCKHVLPVCMSKHYMHLWCLQKSQHITGPGIGVTGGCVMPAMQVLGSEPGSSKRASAIDHAALSLAPLPMAIWTNFSLWYQSVLLSRDESSSLDTMCCHYSPSHHQTVWLCLHIDYFSSLIYFYANNYFNFIARPRSVSLSILF